MTGRMSEPYFGWATSVVPKALRRLGQLRSSKARSNEVDELKSWSVDNERGATRRFLDQIFRAEGHRGPAILQRRIA